MATWDATKEREQFKIDAENLKNDIDAIQSEKLKMVQDELGQVEAQFLNFKSDFVHDQAYFRKHVGDCDRELGRKIKLVEKDLLDYKTKAKNYLIVNYIFVFVLFLIVLIK